MATEQGLRYAELTCTPYTSVSTDPARDFAGMSIEAYTEAIEAARVEAERDFGLVLRWIYDVPGEFGVPAADETSSRRSTTARGADRVRARRAGDRGRRGRSSSRTSTARGTPGCTACRTPVRPPARRRSGTRSPAARRADRARHVGGPGPGAARPPGADRDAPRGLSLLQHRHPCGGHARGAPDPRLPRRRGGGDRALRRPADVRDHAQQRVRDRRGTCSTSTRRDCATWPGPPCTPRSLRPTSPSGCWTRSTADTG